MDVHQGLLYAILPALVGAGVAIGMLAAARARLMDAEARTRAQILLALPPTAPILAFVAAWPFEGAASEARIALGVLGLACLGQTVAQGFLGARWMREGGDASRFGRALMVLAACEVPTALATAWVLLLGSATAEL